MNLEEIKQWIEANKEDQEVKDYINGIAPEKEITVDGVNEFLDTDEGKKLLQPMLDKYHAKSLESWKSKNLEKIISDELQKRTSDKDDKDIAMDEMKKEIEAIKRDKLKESLRNSSFKFATDNSLPTDLIDYFIKIESDDDETGTKSKQATEENLNTFKEIWSNHLQTTVNEKLKSNGHEPKGGNNENKKSITFEQLQSMSTEEIASLDQDVVNEALKQAK
ncbi:DUF4355 domain-containing protein [Alteribacillus sp. YIM 98480]|uniref:capsid assembly scaffolding protein Gp46 family protein n=1 Tax=Alteribacillus sp. YIM 98480 TaxID=2606599 RepID=UPI00131DDAEC|nr:DUF4355 domain-containing protein [Alteribacillus sp. YIM 98480]